MVCFRGTFFSIKILIKAMKVSRNIADELESINWEHATPNTYVDENLELRSHFFIKGL